MNLATPLIRVPTCIRYPSLRRHIIPDHLAHVFPVLFETNCACIEVNLDSYHIAPAEIHSSSFGARVAGQVTIPFIPSVLHTVRLLQQRLIFGKPVGLGGASRTQLVSLGGKAHDKGLAIQQKKTTMRKGVFLMFTHRQVSAGIGPGAYLGPY